MPTITYDIALPALSRSDWPFTCVQFVLPRIGESTRATGDFEVVQDDEILAPSVQWTCGALQFRQDQIDAMNAFGAATERDAFA
jgi:hypothetical protein